MTLTIIPADSVANLRLAQRDICFPLWVTAADSPRELAHILSLECEIAQPFHHPHEPPPTTSLLSTARDLISHADSSPTEFWLLWRRN